MPSNAASSEVHAVIDAWADAMCSRDAARVRAFGTDDFVQFSLAPPLVASDDDGSGLRKWFATWQGPFHYEFRDLAITAGDDVAYGHGLSRMAGTQNGAKVDLWFRHTLCLRKVGGHWKIAHGHQSVPFYMDGSFKAAVDLKP